MKLLSAVVILAALGPPDWRPPAPDVLFTQIDRSGEEVSDNYPAVCGADTCRGTLPVAFADRACVVSGWVKLPDAPGTTASVLFSAGRCTYSNDWHPAETAGAGMVSLDARGAASATFAMSDRDGDSVHLIGPRDEGIAYIRVDIVASTHAHR